MESRKAHCFWNNTVQEYVDSSATPGWSSRFPVGNPIQTHRKLMFKTDDSCWLTSGEQSEVLAQLIDFNCGLIKWDNNRKLPLKAGGTTDVYINVREARNCPKACRFLAGVDRFAEIPDSVSCFAGMLAEEIDRPFITLRDAPKEARVAKATMIGEIRKGERVCLIDDVITTGISKLGPFRTLLGLPVTHLPIVVFVDRQQGWKKGFAETGIASEIWPAMTLHDVRKFLVTSGLIRRCDPAAEEKNPIIVALDGKDWEDVLAVIDPLRTTGCILKVNDLLWARGFDRLLPDLSVYGRVMADIKGHDIPNTLENISKRLLLNPPWAVTVHGSGGEKMIKSVVDVLKGTPTKVLVVTVPTSIDLVTSKEIYHRVPLDQVKTLAAIGDRAGAHGFVCSPQEVGELRALYPNKTFVTPGVRSPGVEVGDQARVDTPANAIQNGATHLVMGRQILGAKDPVVEVNRALREELKLA